MKFQIQMKDPDGVSDSIEEAAKKSASEVQGLSDEEREELIDSRANSFSKIIERWFEYQEYLTVEIDTDTKTISVVDRAV